LEYGGTLGVPALFHHTLCGELLKLSSTAGAKRVLTEHADKAFRVPLPEALLDIDTIEDYRYLRELSTNGRA
jgi:molybdenum cofactor cytidylyltransferase